MIHYGTANWFEVIFTYVGTVWPHIRVNFLLSTLYSCAAYLLSQMKGNVGSEGRTILFGTMSFLLIFRANQAYSRYWEGRTMVTDFFSGLREIIMVSLIYIRGGVQTSTFLFHGGPGLPPKSVIPEDSFDQMAREMRVDVVRLSVALAVAYKLHAHLAHDGYCFGHISREAKWAADFDRFRLRLLLSEEEFGIVDGLVGIDDPTAMDVPDQLEHLCRQFGLGKDTPPADWPDSFSVDTSCLVRVPIAITYFLREMLFRSVNDNLHKQPWGIKERFLTSIEGMILEMQHNFEMTHQIITTPVPLPYANLCKSLLLLFLLSLPFFVDYRLGWFANTVIPSIITMALLGIDAIATELENPFGDDDNDLELLESINVLEREAMEMMRLAGDDQGCDHFCWRELPGFVKARSCRAVQRQLAVREFASAVPGGHLGPGGARRKASLEYSFVSSEAAAAARTASMLSLEISG